MPVNGETCTRIRRGREDREGEEPKTVYLYDFNDNGMGGTEEHPYFSITADDVGLFEPGQVYARVEIEEKSGLVGGVPAEPEESVTIDGNSFTGVGGFNFDEANKEASGAPAGDPPVEGEEGKPDAPKRSHSRKAK